MKTYEGKVAIITGGASGIGRALGEELTRRGASVVLADVNSKLLGEVVESITKAGGRTKAVTLDVTDLAAVKRLVEDTVSEWGRLNYLFNNAGIAIGGEARDLSYDDWKKVIDTNLYGVINGVFAAYPVMVKQGFGHIINTASIAGLAPFAGEISYTISKYGVMGLSHTLRAEAADLGVKVSVVCPGKIETPIYQTSKVVGADREKVMAIFPKGITPEKCASIILRGVERNRATIVVTSLAKFLWLLQRISPSLTIGIARRLMRKIRTFRIDD
ncbi:MAG: SDR family oxidoreductase [Deltaproteobacteria bacterium]|nr:MAG: SDR family oxidoreductase [Deltaproteobacteria bacterium]